MTITYQLIPPTISLEKEILAYKNEFPASAEGIAGTSYLSFATSISDWLADLKKFESRETIPDNLVPGFEYLLVAEHSTKILGMLNLRTELNDTLEKFGGHIGYSIAPSERRQGLGKEILRLGLEKARELNLEKVLLVCNETNPPSQKIIEANGGQFEDSLFDSEDNQRVFRYWISLEN
ncbi:GNAT family N-acetyltransferase [Enterococcus sp. LJL90]